MVARAHHIALRTGKWKRVGVLAAAAHAVLWLYAMRAREPRTSLEAQLCARAFVKNSIKTLSTERHTCYIRTCYALCVWHVCKTFFY